MIQLGTFKSFINNALFKYSGYKKYLSIFLYYLLKF